MDESKKSYENDNVYCMIYQWMISRLELTGVELILYAVIYSYTESESKMYSGSIAYLQYRTGASKVQVIKKLKMLVDKGYIERQEVYKDGVKYVNYWSTKLTGVVNLVNRGGEESLPGVVNLVNRGGKQSEPHNKEHNKDTKESSYQRTQEDVSEREGGTSSGDTPDIQEIMEYIWQRQYYVDVEKFYDYYESRGWKRKNGRPIDDWRKLVDEWEERDKRTRASSPPVSTGTQTAKNAPTVTSFETDDFFMAALKKSYGEDFDGG